MGSMQWIEGYLNLNQLSRVSLLMIVVLASITMACSDVKEPTATPRVFNPTPAPTEVRSATEHGVVVEENGGSAAVAVGASGNPERGRQLYTQNGCSGCHSTSDEVIVGPGHRGVAERSASAVVGMSGEEYMRQSIKEPGAHLVEGFTNLMPSFANLDPSDIDDLIAYLKTLD